jgi:cytochrome b561
MRHPVHRFDLLTIILHWLIAIFILGLIVLGFVMTRPSIDPVLQFSLFQWHKSLGMLALLFAVARFVHSVIRVRVEPVGGMKPFEPLLAKITHCILLGLTILVPLAGWMIASVSPLEIPTFAFNLIVVPHLPVPKSDAAEIWWATAHAVLAYSTLALVFLHSSASLYHHYWRHDDVLTRMLNRERRLIEPSAKEPTS